MRRRTASRSRRLGAAEPDDEALCAVLAAGLRIQGGARRWRITGSTHLHRRLLREAGGIWNKVDQCWEFAGEDPTARLAAALEGLTLPALGGGYGEPASLAPVPPLRPPPPPQILAAPPRRERHLRMCERVLATGIEPLPDDELLELVLLYATDNADSRTLAGKLLDRFGTLGDIFAAEPAQLAEFHVEPRTLALFKSLREVGRRLAQRKVKDMPVLTNWQQLIDYCHVAVAHEKVEQFRVLFLDRKNVLIVDEVQQRGTIDHTPVYPREVVKRALALNAAALILVHNHPSGDPKPSREDIEMTREVKAAAEALGIAIHDHLVIGRKGHASFRSLGLL
ncbi:MAG: RadC family protein [Pseudomonadota bacterium]